eukprot:UN23877
MQAKKFEFKTKNMFVQITSKNSCDIYQSILQFVYGRV